MSRHFFAVLLILTLSLAACSPAATPTPPPPVYTVLSTATLSPSDDIPPAPENPEDVVLTISGKITRTNTDDNTLALDMETLEKLQIVEMKIDDAVGTSKNVPFQGVLLTDVLALAGADMNASTLKGVALDDYSADIPMSDLKQYPVLLALKMENEYLELGSFGPTRVVYPNNDFEFDATVYEQRWIWSLASVEVSE